jgi:hypothetical protein
MRSQTSATVDPIGIFKFSILNSCFLGLTPYQPAASTQSMPPILLRSGQVLMLLVLFAASGGHWMALQSVAWTRMLMTYSRDGHLVAAVTKTFDGRHPCALCKQIVRAKSGEPRPAHATEVDNQAAFVAPTLVVIVKKEGLFWKMEIPEWHGEVRAEQPTAPPPRGMVA